LRQFAVWLVTICLTLTACSSAQSAAPLVTEPSIIAPGFTLKTLDGKPLSLADYRGKWVLVNFWATWCVPCVQEMPFLQQTVTAHADRLVVLGVNMREDDVTIRNFAEQHHITYPLLVHPDDQISLGYAIRGLPVTAVVAPDGTLFRRIVGVLTPEVIQSVLSS